MSEYICYILKCNNYTYNGCTNNFKRRIRQHNGEIKGGARCTSRRGPWQPYCIITGFKDNLGAFEFVLIFLLCLINALVIIYFFYYLAKLSINKSIKLIKQYSLKMIDKLPIVQKILSKNIIDKINKWNKKKIINTYGINLKSNYEIELFNYYFAEKKIFSNKINSILDQSDLDLFYNFLEGKR